jgi:hypothetical protein
MPQAVSKAIYAPEAQTGTIGKQTITLEPNTKHANLATSINQYLKSDDGLFRFGQLGERIPKFVNEVRKHYGMPSLPPFDRCSEKSFQAWTWLTTIPRAITMTPGVITDVQDAAVSLNDSTLNSQQKRHKIEKAVQQVADASAMYCYSVANLSSLFPSLNHVNVAALNAGSTFTTAYDAIGLHVNAENMARAMSVDVTKATQEMQETVKGTVRYNMLAAAKHIVAFATGFFAVLHLASGISILPILAAATMSLASTVFAVMRKLYEDSMPFKPINFLDNRHVTLIA